MNHHLWHSFQSIGIGEDTPAGEAQRVVLLNRLCLVVIFVTAILLYPFFLDRKIWGGMISVICLMTACVSLWLNHRQRYELARWSIVLLISGLISLTFAKSGTGTGIEISYLSVIIGIMMLFTEWETRITLIGINVGGYLLTLILGPGWLFSPFGTHPSSYSASLVFLGNMFFVILAIESMLSYRKEIEGNLAQANQQLKAQNDDLETFNHAISHHLKTAIRSIVGYLDLAKRVAGNMTDTEQGQYVEKARSSARDLQLMVVDLMTLVGLSDTQKEAHWFDLAPLTEEVVTSLEPIIHQHQAQVIIQELPEVLAHPVHFQLLLHNLIQNGIKYNDKEIPEVIVSAYVRGEGLLLQIQDNGIGISQEMQAKVFAPFARLHSSDQYEGNGLGLAVCQKIVDHYQGYIQLTSALGCGSKFDIYLQVPVRVNGLASSPFVSQSPSQYPMLETNTDSYTEETGIR